MRVFAVVWGRCSGLLTILLALAGALESFEGVMIFLSDHLTLDKTLVPYIQEVALPAPSAQSVKKIFCAYLDQLGPDLVTVESRDRIVQWIAAAAGRLLLSIHDARQIYRVAVDLSEQRPLTLNDVIKAYRTTTGRPDEWDLVTDTSLYADGQTSETSTPPEIADHLFETFGPASMMPDDGRVLLGFSRSSYSTVPPLDAHIDAHMGNTDARTGINRLSKAAEDLWKVGGLRVVDWGWPEGLWAPTVGCVYDLEEAAQSPTVVPSPQQQWQDAKFTFGPRDLLNTAQHGLPECGKPWRRLV